MGSFSPCACWQNSASANTYTVGGGCRRGVWQHRYVRNLVRRQTFGGTGIPNVGQITKIGQSRARTFGHSAYENPPLTNDGHGTFQAIVGNGMGSDHTTNSNYAKWNFGLLCERSPPPETTTKLFYGTGPNLTQFITRSMG